MIWQSPQLFDIPSNIQTWLLHAGSFMQRLKDQGINDAKIHVLSEAWQMPFECEQQRLNLYSTMWIREVLIHSPRGKLMYARTVIPKEILQHKYAEIVNLENRAIGSILFNDPAIVRSHFELALLKPGVFLMEKAMEQLNFHVDQLWARRSTFDLQGRKLLLSEVFLPVLF